MKVPIPVFSSDDKLSWGQTEWSLNQYLHLQHENNLGRERVRKNKPIIFQLSFPLCKGKSITCWTPYSVHLGNYNLSSQYVHAEWLMMVNKQHIQKLSLLPSSWLTHWNSTFQKVQEMKTNAYFLFMLKQPYKKVFSKRKNRAFICLLCIFADCFIWKTRNNKKLK